MVSFSGSGLTGRMNLPATKWIKTKKTATTTNSAMYPTSSVMNILQLRQNSELLIGHFQSDLTPARKAGIQLVPMRHLRLTQLPAQVHLAFAHHGGKVDESCVEVFNLDAEFLKLLDVFAYLFLILFQFLLHLFLVGILQLTFGRQAVVAILQAIGQLRNVSHNGPG